MNWYEFLDVSDTWAERLDDSWIPVICVIGVVLIVGIISAIERNLWKKYSGKI